MSEQKRGTMGLNEADSPLSVLISGILIIGSIVLLVLWALQSAYPYS